MAQFWLCCVALLAGLQTAGSYKVAVIGAGVGGSAAAFFLKHNGTIGGEPRQDLKIDLFDKDSDGTCGRLATASINERVYEVGGAVLHRRNRLAKQLADNFGLEADPQGTYDNSKGQPRMLLVNGSTHILETSGYSLISAFRMLMRYGFDLFTLQRHVNRLMDGFERVYSAHDNGTAFSSLKELLEYQGLYNLTLTSTRSYLQTELGVSSLLVDELVSGVTRVNYNQEPDMMALAGMVGLAGNSNDLWRIAGGNNQLCNALRTAAGAVKVQSYTVTGIQSAKSKHGPSDFRLVLHDEEENEEISDRYDAVVIASPLQKGFSLPAGAAKVPTLPYQTTICTIVQGQPKAGIFGYEDACALPEVVLTVPSEKQFVSSFGRLHSTASTDAQPCPGVFKVFSRKTLTKVQLQSMFASKYKTQVFKWAAYPKYSSSVKAAPFQLLPGVYYANGIEAAASSIEMALISARNAALLAAQHLSQSSEAPVESLEADDDESEEDNENDEDGEDGNQEEEEEKDRDHDEDDVAASHEEL
eukprot:m.43889 g.43889  ORF g.43889 m.43889 type:complete len:529 (-) comp12971_c0_seq2:85-1671(-)